VNNLSSKLEYALLAAMDLAANYAPRSPVKTQDIARRTGAPAKFLGQILLRLKERALVHSAKGRAGGYWLMRRPELISACEILDAVAPTADRRQGRPLPETVYTPTLRRLADKMAAARRAALSAVSLADLASTARSAQ